MSFQFPHSHTKWEFFFTNSNSLVQVILYHRKFIETTKNLNITFECKIQIIEQERRRKFYSSDDYWIRWGTCLNVKTFSIFSQSQHHLYNLYILYVIATAAVEIAQKVTKKKNISQHHVDSIFRHYLAFNQFPSYPFSRKSNLFMISEFRLWIGKSCPNFNS